MILKTIFRFENLKFRRNLSNIVHHLGSYLLLALIFPLSTNMEQAELITMLARAAIWIALAFATLLAIRELFRVDLEEGVLEQHILGPHIYAYIASKLCCYFVWFSLPLVIFTPILLTAFAVQDYNLAAVLLAVSLGSLNFILIGAFISALLLIAKQNNFTLTIVLLPLYIPTIIFGTSATANMAWQINCALLAAMSCVLVVITPWLMKFALRNACS